MTKTLDNPCYNVGMENIEKMDDPVSAFLAFNRVCKDQNIKEFRVQFMYQKPSYVKAVYRGTSVAQAEANKRNGMLGGRPRKADASPHAIYRRELRARHKLTNPMTNPQWGED